MEVFITPPFANHVDILKHLHRKLLKKSLHRLVRKCNTVHLLFFFKYQDHS